jgi:hypothetical protein
MNKALTEADWGSGTQKFILEALYFLNKRNFSEFRLSPVCSGRVNLRTQEPVSRYIF